VNEPGTGAGLSVLLLVQERDLALDRLRHRRATLPARAELTGVEAELVVATRRAEELRSQRDGVLAEERRLDAEAQRLAAKVQEAHDHLYSGSVSSPRELQALQADLDQLRRQQGVIEDEELERMEVRDGLDAELATAEAEVARLGADADRVRAGLLAAEAEVDAEIASETQARADLAAGLAEGLVADYEQRRARNRGSGAARLVGNTCQACHLSIPSTEVERIRRAPDGEIASCDNCGAILVPA